VFAPNVSEVFTSALARNGDGIAIETTSRSITYSELAGWTARIAGAMRRRGVSAGDVVAMFTDNCPEFIATDVATARLGAVRLPVNHLLPAEAVANMLETADARVLVVSSDLVEVALPAIARLGQNLIVLQVSDGRTPLAEGASWLEALESADEQGDLRAVALDSDAPAALLFTGGTTGKPKGVVHTQHSWVSFHTAQLIEAEIREQDRLLIMTPLAHAAGVFAQSALLRGATVVLRNGFDAAATLRDFRAGMITWTFLVPTMIYRLLDAVGDVTEAFPSLQTIVYGAAPISPSRLERALQVFGPVFIQLYGQTECPNWATRLPKSAHNIGRPELLGSCGKASIACEVKIVDEAGDDLPSGQVGEICVRSPYTLARYHNNPQATTEKFLGDWIRTGDIGLLDEAGYVYLKDRRGDMIISGGMNVYSREVEDTLSGHPQVKSVAILGIPDDDWGEVVHAFVVADPTLTEDQLREWTRGRIAGYARPKKFEFVSRLPETPFGKVDKKQLRSRYWGDSQRAIH
jgi:fatty-acyl-CoA synthase/long-chain acyl-CoA synthetase